MSDGGGILTGACTKPCHTFDGVVDQWRFSNHSHPQNTEIGGGSCGNCHGIDGLQKRLDDKYVVTGDSGAPVDVPKGHINYRASSGAVSEIGYGGATTIGRIHCSTCHDFNPATDPHETGSYQPHQAPIRVPGGTNDVAMLEKTEGLSPTNPTGTPLSYRVGNVCVFCHKSRKDVSFFVAAQNAIANTRWGPHDGPQADVYSGKGGFHFTGRTYSPSTHTTIANACVSCHMPPKATNGNVPDHSMKPTVEFCKTCHLTYTGSNFDVQGGQSLVRNALSELETLLNDRGLLTRSSAAPYAAISDADLADHQFHLDATRPASGDGGTNQVLDAPTAGALYNYLIVARSKDLGVHNPTYAKQLLWDSIAQIKGSNPSSLPARPQ